MDQRDGLLASCLHLLLGEAEFRAVLGYSFRHGYKKKVGRRLCFLVSFI